MQYHLLIKHSDILLYCLNKCSVCTYPGSKNYWSDIEVASTQYNLNIAPIGFAAWVLVSLTQTVDIDAIQFKSKRPISNSLFQTLCCTRVHSLVNIISLYLVTQLIHCGILLWLLLTSSTPGQDKCLTWDTHSLCAVALSPQAPPRGHTHKRYTCSTVPGPEVANYT